MVPQPSEVCLADPWFTQKKSVLKNKKIAIFLILHAKRKELYLGIGICWVFLFIVKLFHLAGKKSTSLKSL